MMELSTDRLRLREIRQTDAPRIFSCWASDPAVTRYLTWHPHENLAQTQAIVRQWVAAYDDPHTYRYGIKRKSDAALMGMIDVVTYRQGAPVIGYCAGRAYWGCGYMTEALRALTAQLFADGYDTIIIEAIAENIGSNRVIEKCGFTRVESRREPISPAKPETVTVHSYRLCRQDAR